MNAFLRTVLPAAVAALAFASTTVGQDRKVTPAREPSSAVELEAGNVVLPTSTTGSIVMKVCAKCALKSYPVTGATKYYLYADAVTLPEFTAALVGQPKAYVGVLYSPKTGQVMEINAHARRVAR
jgi:hypothetical protein